MELDIGAADLKIQEYISRWKDRETQIPRTNAVAKFEDILFKPVSDDGYLCLLWARSIYDKQVLRWAAKKYTRYFQTYEEELAFLETLTLHRSFEPYLVLGLSHLARIATQDDIAEACIRRVVIVDMNERLSAGEKLDLSEDYYYCIMAAFQAISSESKRQFMDLVTASSTMEMFPIPKSFENPDEFFQSLETYFEAASRFSSVQPVPLLGNMNYTRDQVEYFYQFWRDFKSTRLKLMDDGILPNKTKSFSSLNFGYRSHHRVPKPGKKVKTPSGQGAEDAKIQRFVQIAYKNDPRIAMYTELDNEKIGKAERNIKSESRTRNEKNIKRRENKIIRQRHLLDDQLQLNKAQTDKVKEQNNECDKNPTDVETQTGESSQSKQAEKKALKKARQKLRAVFAAHNYYVEGNEKAIPIMTFLEQLCANLDIADIKELTSTLQNMGFDEGRLEIQNYIEVIIATGAQEASNAKPIACTVGKNCGNAVAEKCSKWTEEELLTLLKTGASKRKDKWAEIEMLIPGKSKKECVAKFKNFSQ